MKLRTIRRLEASPAEVWQILHDPVNMPAWNEKCREVRADGPFREGQRFEVLFQMRGRPTTADGEVLRYRPEQSLHFRYHYEDAAGVGEVDETFEIEPAGSTYTRVTHIVDFSRSHLPWWLKYLIGFMGRFGKAQNKGPLDHVAEILKT